MLLGVLALAVDRSCVFLGVERSCVFLSVDRSCSLAVTNRACFVPGLIVRTQATNVSKDALLLFHHAFMEALGGETSLFYKQNVSWPAEDSEELDWALRTYALLGLPG